MTAPTCRRTPSLSSAPAGALDDPLWKQHLAYLQLLHFAFGVSMPDGSPALSRVMERVHATLALPALMLTLCIGIPARLRRAAPGIHRRPWGDPAVDLRLTIPSLLLGLVLVRIFAVMLDWTPSGGQNT